VRTTAGNAAAPDTATGVRKIIKKQIKTNRKPK
jgi:hypothetical protein